MSFVGGATAGRSRQLRGGLRGFPRLDRQDPINQGLVGYWSMDGGTIAGTRIVDLSGNGNNGVLAGSPSLVNGQIGQALLFDGGTQYASVPHSNSLSVTTGGAVSMSFWMYNTSATTGVFWGLISKRDDTLGTPFAYGMNFRRNDVFEIYTSGASGVQNFAYIPPVNQWIHVVAVISSGPTALYINGDLFGTSGTGGGCAANTAPLNIALSSLGAGFVEYFPGAFDDIRIYNRILSPSEVRRIFSDRSGNLGLLAPMRVIARMTASGFQPAWAVQSNQIFAGS